MTLIALTYYTALLQLNDVSSQHGAAQCRLSVHLCDLWLSLQSQASSSRHFESTLSKRSGCSCRQQVKVSTHLQICTFLQAAPLAALQSSSNLPVAGSFTGATTTLPLALTLDPPIMIPSPNSGWGLARGPALNVRRNL